MKKICLLLMGIALVALYGANQKAKEAKEITGEEISVFEYNPNAPHSPAAFSSVDSANLTPNQQKGQQIYAKWCLPCHGVGMPGTNALQALYNGALPALLEDRDDLNADAVEMWVRMGKHSMPFFRKTEINDTELKFLADYLSRNVK